MITRRHLLPLLWGFVLYSASGCTSDTSSTPSPWLLREDPAEESDPRVESDSPVPDMDQPSDDSATDDACLSGVLPATNDFKFDEFRWHRVFEAFITNAAIYQLSISLKKGTTGEWTSIIEQRLCIRDEQGGTIWSFLPPFTSPNQDILGEGNHDKSWIHRGIIELFDSSGSMYALDCARGLGDVGGAEEPPWLSSGVMLNGHTWYDLPDVDHMQSLQPEHDLAQWSDGFYGDPVVSHPNYTRIDYTDHLGLNIYWPKIWATGLQPSDEAHAQHLALCAKNRLTPWYGAPPTVINKAFHKQTVESLKLPESAKRYIHDTTYSDN